MKKHVLGLIAACALACGAETNAPSAGLGLTDRFVSMARKAYGEKEYANYTKSMLYAKPFAQWTGRADIPVVKGLVRWVDVGGTANFRDIGGWNGLKTGRVWRGAEPNCQPPEVAKARRFSYHDLSLTPEGVKTLSQKLKIKTDLDLRNHWESPTPDRTPIEGARLVRIPCSSYTNFLNDVKKAAQLLRVFADEKNYPIYFHCYGGADRTGSLAFVLEGLCGVCESDLSIDYELTSFSRIGRRARDGQYAPMVQAMKKRPGATLTEKIEWWAREECGLSIEEIGLVRQQLGFLKHP